MATAKLKAGLPYQITLPSRKTVVLTKDRKIDIKDAEDIKFLAAMDNVEISGGSAEPEVTEPEVNETPEVTEPEVNETPEGGEEKIAGEKKDGAEESLIGSNAVTSNLFRKKN